MKKLEFNQMELRKGSDAGLFAGLACGGSIIFGALAIYGSGGLAAAVVCNVAAASCGGILGHGSKTGHWF